MPWASAASPRLASSTSPTSASAPSGSASLIYLAARSTRGHCQRRALTNGSIRQRPASLRSACLLRFSASVSFRPWLSGPRRRQTLLVEREQPARCDVLIDDVTSPRWARYRSHCRPGALRPARTRTQATASTSTSHGRTTQDFVAGYGMDCAQRYRNLPYIDPATLTDANGASSKITSARCRSPQPAHCQPVQISPCSVVRTAPARTGAPARSARARRRQPGPGAARVASRRSRFPARVREAALRAGCVGGIYGIGGGSNLAPILIGTGRRPAEVVHLRDICGRSDRSLHHPACACSPELADWNRPRRRRFGRCLRWRQDPFSPA